MSSAVADAGPLIHLTEIGSLSLLQIFDIVHVPNAVRNESVRPGRVSKDDLAALACLQRHRLPSGQVERFVRENQLERLEAGEREAQYLCQQMNVPVLLTDDLAVREATRHLGMRAVGSLGVVVGAYHKGQLSLTEAEEQLGNVYRVSSLFVTWTIVELAIEQLRQKSEADR